MKAALTVIFKLDKYGQSFEQTVSIDGPFQMAFDPIDRCDDPRVAFAVGAPMPDVVRAVAKKREGYAKTLGEFIAGQIVEMMGSRDTINGYPVVEHTTPKAR